MKHDWNACLEQAHKNAFTVAAAVPEKRRQAVRSLICLQLETGVPFDKGMPALVQAVLPTSVGREVEQ